MVLGACSFERWPDTTERRRWSARVGCMCARRTKRRGCRCRICGRNRPNEQFGGKGRSGHICKKCRKRPKTEVERIELELEIAGFLEQSNISAKNIKRLESLTTSAVTGISDLASLVLAVARVKPHKRRRFKFLARNDRPLLNRLIQSGLLVGYVDDNIADLDHDEMEAFFHEALDCGLEEFDDDEQ